MEEPVTITWEPTVGDIRHAVNYQFSRLQVRFVVGLPLVAAVGFIFYLVAKGESYRAGVVFGCALPYLVFCALLPQFVVRRVMPTEGASASRTETYSDAGIDVFARGQVFHLPWSAFTSVQERDDIYLLVRPGFPLPVPKRAFIDAEHEARFRDLLVRRGLLATKGDSPTHPSQ